VKYSETSCDRSKSWTNVAFLGYQADAQVFLGVKVTQGLEDSIEWQSLPGKFRRAVLNEGPGGRNLQDVKAAAEKPDVDEDDSGPEPDREVTSMPTATKGPLHSLFEYVAEVSFRPKLDHLVAWAT